MAATTNTVEGGFSLNVRGDWARPGEELWNVYTIGLSDGKPPRLGGIELTDTPDYPESTAPEHKLYVFMHLQQILHRHPESIAS